MSDDTNIDRSPEASGCAGCGGGPPEALLAVMIVLLSPLALILKPFRITSDSWFERVVMVLAYVIATPFILVWVVWLVIVEFRMRVVFTLLAAALVFIPSVMLLRYPDEYTPLTAFLISAAMTAAGVVASIYIERARIARQLNAKWLPQAESACDRLLTLTSDATRLRSEIECMCTSATEVLPEIDQAKMKAVKVLLREHCGATAGKLASIENHLRSAYNDWYRFIQQNCDRGECAVIFKALEDRERELAQAHAPAMPTPGPCAPPVNGDAASMLPPQ